MSIAYEKGSMKNLDKDGDGKADHLQLAMVNKVGSGGVTADLKVFVDGVDVTGSSTLSVSGKPPQRIRPAMYVYANYGDRVVLEVEHGGKIGPGRHKVKLQATVDWQTFAQEFEDEVS